MLFYIKNRTNPSHPPSPQNPHLLQNVAQCPIILSPHRSRASRLYRDPRSNSADLYIFENLAIIKKMTEQVEAHVLKKYSLVKKVGSGAYGHVWKVTDKKSGDTLALKKIFDAFQHSTDAQRTFRQITLLQQLDHPNIVKLHQVIRAENDKDLYLVFEFMEADLHNAIGQKILKDAHNRFILYQLAKGLKFLHSAEIIHRDLKPSNLLLNSDCTMKICDFGLARSLIADKFNQDIILTEQVATRWYRAPEVLLGSHSYGKPADIWSMGCILAEILIGKPIFPGTSTLNQLEKIVSFTGKPSKQEIQSLNAETAETMIDQVGQTKQKPLNQWFRPGTPPEAIDLVLKMLQVNPKKRPTAVEILRSPYLASFSNPKEQIESKKMIKPPISDNTKLGLKDYRLLIYDHIKKVYRERDAQNSVSLHNSDSLRKMERPNTAQKHDKQDSSSSNYYFRNNSNNSRNDKPKTTETKVSQHLGTTNKPITNASSYYEDQEKLKKKNSLKDLLKNKKPLMNYKAPTESKGSIIKKSYKDYEICASTKENRNAYGKFM